MTQWIKDRYPNENEGDEQGRILILHKNGEKYFDSVEKFCDTRQMNHVLGWITPPSGQWITDRYPEDHEADEWGCIIILRKDGIRDMAMVDVFWEERQLKRVMGWMTPPAADPSCNLDD